MRVYVVSCEDSGDTRETDSAFDTQEEAEKRVEELLNKDWVDMAYYDELTLNKTPLPQKILHRLLKNWKIVWDSL